MSFMEIVIIAWTCDSCGIEAVHGDDGIPEGWVLSPDGERHACPVCIPPSIAARLPQAVA